MTSIDFEPVIAWLDFLRDIGVQDISLDRTGATNIMNALPVTQPSAALPETLDQIRADIGDCTRCKLHKHRRTIVFGSGNERTEIMFVGEGPGEDEDEKGLPFVGRAGELLTKMIIAMGYRREDVYIANVVKCRPPENRNPDPDEVATCAPFLRRQILAIHPKAIVALGAFAARLLTGSPDPISRIRGKVFSYEGIPVMPTYHPAYLLRAPSMKKDAWEDLQQVMRMLGKPVNWRPGKPKPEAPGN